MVDYLKAFSWVTWYGGKFSTSERRGIFLDQALELYPADYWRWALIANSPESSDSAFTIEQFQNQINSDLANVYGNFVSRVVGLCHSKFDSAPPSMDGLSDVDRAHVAKIDEKVAEIKGHFETMEFRRAAAAIRALWVLGNEYITERKPWALAKTDPEEAAACIGLCLRATRK